MPSVKNPYASSPGESIAWWLRLSFCLHKDVKGSILAAKTTFTVTYILHYSMTSFSVTMEGRGNK